MYWRLNDLSFIAAVSVSLVVIGCGGADAGNPPTTSFPVDPYAVLTSEEGKLTIEVRTGPAQPPVRGKTDVQLLVRDRAGALVDGLDIRATLWMPVMGHGGPDVPAASSEGDGQYALRSASMYMPGLWELQTTFSGIVMDSVTPVFDVP